MEFVGVTLAPPGGAFNAVDERLADAAGVAREAVLAFDWLPDGSTLILYRLAGDPATVAAAVESHDDVRAHELAVREDAVYLYVHADAGDPLAGLLDIVDRHALLLRRPLRVTADGLFVVVTGESDALQQAFAELPEDVGVTVEETGTALRDQRAPLAGLTDRQREALEAALESGYYETPRRATCEEVAAQLGCTASTANELLRRAESTLVRGVLGR